jgi:hypothetical protein
MMGDNIEEKYGSFIYDFETLSEYFVARIKKEGLQDIFKKLIHSETNFCNRYAATFLSSAKTILYYNYCLDTIKKDYLETTFYDLEKNSHVNLRKDFIIFMNMNMVLTLFHEIEHLIQWYIYDEKKTKEYELLKKWFHISFSRLNIKSCQLPHEHYANINSGIKALAEFDYNGNNPSINIVLEQFNRILAREVLYAYAYKKNDGFYRGPWTYISELERKLNNSDYPNIFYIENNIECLSLKPMGLQKGSNIPVEVYDEIKKIREGKVKTKNLYKHIELLYNDN